jgi:RNA recognition motif-containing protein
MGDILPGMTESFILNAFYNYEIRPTGVKLIMDKKTNKIKNYCFINFANIQNANEALTKLNGKPIIGTQYLFKLNWANYHKGTNKSVYVGNLSPEINDIDLYNFFKKKYDSVHHANVITDNGISKGYGFVLFTNENEYLKCLNEMNGIVFHGNHIKVKEQKKKEENETINLSYQINQNGSSRSSISTVTQSMSSSTSSGNLSLLENINSMNFYPKNLNTKIFNNNNYYGNNNAFSLNDNKFEIFEILDQETLYKKIRYAIEKMKEHYCYYYMGDKSKLKSKNTIFIFLIF